MEIDEVPLTDVRGPLTAQRGRLLGLLSALDDAQWATRTVAPQWSVKDIALHLIAVDLGWLARDRDHDRSSLIAVPDGHEQFVQALDQHNQQWVDGAQGLSPRLVTGLLAWSGEQLDAYLASVDLTRASSVYWAGAVPQWFDIAREFTERWAHYRQIEEAVRPARPEQEQDEYLPLVLRTFIWGFPHQYQAQAAPGTTIAVEIPGIAAWTLTRTPTGWTLDEGRPARPAAGLRMSGDAAWRLLTGAPYDTHQVELSGDQELAKLLLQVRGIIV